MFFAIPFPMIDPVLVEIGPLRHPLVRAGLYRRHRARLAARAAPGAPARPWPPPREQLDDFVTWVTLGIILGGRLGYVLFYRPGYYLEHPLEALTVWQGGMSFHGGMLGVIVATWLVLPAATAWTCCRFARPRGRGGADRAVLRAARQLHQWRALGPRHRRALGHGLPRRRPGCRATPASSTRPGWRGCCLFVLLMVLVARARRSGPGRGFITGVFLRGYGVARIIGEFFRQPDAHLGFLFAGATMGQLLSLPMLAGRRSG